jgi:hypothetical protein
MAVFGFGGRGTEALGELLLRSPDRFWPPCCDKNGRQVGIYVCEFSFEMAGAGDGDGDLRLKDVETHELDKGILKKHGS